MATSNGPKHCTRYKLKNSIRERGLICTIFPISNFWIALFLSSCNINNYSNSKSNKKLTLHN